LESERMELTTVGLPSARARCVMIAGNAPTTPTAAAPLRKRRRATEDREPNGDCESTMFSSPSAFDATDLIA
jgi:hypothetical protein